MIDLIFANSLPIDAIITADTYFRYPDIPADLPEMESFKEYADNEIYARYGMKVEHFHADSDFETMFLKSGGNSGYLYGYPRMNVRYCTSGLKTAVLDKVTGNSVTYIGIASDELKRISHLKPNQNAPLFEMGITEKECFAWCEMNGLLSPLYTKHKQRGGCWFCPMQTVDSLRDLRTNHYDLFCYLLALEDEALHSGKKLIPFSQGHYLYEWHFRFICEECGLVPIGKNFVGHF